MCTSTSTSTINCAWAARRAARVRLHRQASACSDAEQGRRSVRLRLLLCLCPTTAGAGSVSQDRAANNDGRRTTKRTRRPDRRQHGRGRCAHFKTGQREIGVVGDVGDSTTDRSPTETGGGAHHVKYSALVCIRCLEAMSTKKSDADVTQTRKTTSSPPKEKAHVDHDSSVLLVRHSEISCKVCNYM